MEDKKEIEVVSGNGSNLDISAAYDYLSAEKPKKDINKPKNIVIPKIKSKEDNKDTDNDDSKKEEN